MTNSWGAITNIKGISVGHYTDLEHATGCTVVLCPEGAIGGVDQRGTAPGTRETDLLRPGQLVEQIHAILLTGGSAYGLDAAGGVMRWLEEHGYGFRMGEIIIPVVPAAVIFDLSFGSSNVRPGAEHGYQACVAQTDESVAEGTVGAGTGATVAKTLGRDHSIKGGVGTASIDLGNDLVVAAIAVVNASGDIVEPETGRIIAGPRKQNGGGFHNSVELMMEPDFTRPGPQQQTDNSGRTATTLGIVVTNAPLNKAQTNKLAERAQDGMALAVRPCHTQGDGDTVFGLATGTWQGTLDRGQLQRVSNAAAQAMARAIIRGVTEATSLAGVPALKELSDGQ